MLLIQKQCPEQILTKAPKSLLSMSPPPQLLFYCISDIPTINHSSQAKMKGCHQRWHLGASRPTHSLHPSRTPSPSCRAERKKIPSERETSRLWDCQKTSGGDSDRVTTEWPWAAPEHKEPGTTRKLSAWECHNGQWLWRETLSISLLVFRLTAVQILPQLWSFQTLRHNLIF